MVNHLMRRIITLFSRTSTGDAGEIDADAVQAALDAPSLVTGLENFTPLRDSPLRDRLIAFASDATDA